ncbi:FtsH protease activity modulator HflK [Butyrivibrio sp.]|uniref:FtsH protease activity modulator HflK n=1 Tax=Butyrivibrio sp. TaxID=28121 RepID=UPI0025C10292|nr:FtsH protease activity modulator HflK [Butyrivibrio sp.]MBE5836836.1 FtsH protease activity modulator HflK [Butyrivibrio sp.]MBQ6414764.1 FtsH protease activity modulator HflK [Butyrivibrio sp.]
MGKNKNGFVKKKISLKVVLIVIVALFALTIVNGSFYSVKEQEQAILTMFGKVVRVDTAGLYFKIPYIQQVHLVDMTTHGIGIGYVLKDGQNITVDDEGIMITSDFNFVDIDFYLEYKVSDPVAAYYNSEDPEMIMKNMALASIRNTVVNYPVDDVITTAKGQIQAEVKERLTTELAEKNIGMTVVNISVQDAEPPTEEIVQAFKSVETAKQGKETAVNNAKKYQSEELPKAEAAADKILQDAEAAKQARIAEAEGQVARFNEMYEQYKLQPYITKKRLFYETMEELLPDLKVIITDGNTQQMLPLDSFNG